MSTPEGWAEGDPSNLPGPANHDMFEMLSNRRRRIVVIILATVEGPVELGRMAEYITSVETGEPLSAITSDERKARYISLYQVHAEKMAEAGLIDTENRGYGLTPTERTYRVADRLKSQMATEEPIVIEAINRVLGEAAYGREAATVPLDVSVFRVPTPEQFRELRKSVGVTQTDVAEYIGVSNSTISMFETGETSLRSANLRAAVEYIRRR